MPSRHADRASTAAAATAEADLLDIAATHAERAESAHRAGAGRQRHRRGRAEHQAECRDRQSDRSFLHRVSPSLPMFPGRDSRPILIQLGLGSSWLVK